MPRRCLSTLAVCALAACGSAPVVHLHSLMPGPGAAAAADRPADGSPLVVVLDPIRLPANVDQPQWLVQLPDGSLAVPATEAHGVTLVFK